LQKLTAPKKGAPTAESAGLLDIELAAGKKNGYSFRYVIVGANDLGAPANTNFPLLLHLRPNG